MQNRMKNIDFFETKACDVCVYAQIVCIFMGFGFNKNSIQKFIYLPTDFLGLSSVSTLLLFSNLYPDDLDWDLDSL